MKPSSEVMNVRQAAEYLGISSDTLYKYVAEGQIPGFRLGNRWRFKKSLLDAWMEAASRPPAAAAGSERRVPHRA
jgi:excisionase family DNA binding protein